MHVEAGQHREQRLLDDRAERADDDRLGLRGARCARPTRASLTSSGWKTVDAELAREIGDRRILHRAAAALRAGGRVTTSAGRCGESAAVAARWRRSRRCPGRRCARQSCAAGRGSKPRSRRFSSASRSARSAALALVLAGAVENQHAVEVIHLVLDHAGLQAGGLDLDALADRVPAGDAHVDRAVDVDLDVGEAEAALLERSRRRRSCPLDLGLASTIGRSVADAVDEQAVADCRSAERRGRCRRPRPSGRSCAGLGAQCRRRRSSIARASVRRTGSPNWRTCVQRLAAGLQFLAGETRLARASLLRRRRAPLRSRRAVLMFFCHQPDVN